MPTTQHQQELFEKNKAECVQGISVVFDNIARHHTKKQLEQYQQELTQLTLLIQDQHCWQALTKGEPLRAIADISEECMEAIFHEASTLYQEQRWQEAVSAFSLLCLLDHTSYQFLFLLGSSLFRLKKYEDALLAYTAASFSAIDTSIFIPIIQCLDHMNRKDASLQMAKEALDTERTCQKPNQQRIDLFQRLIQERSR